MLFKALDCYSLEFVISYGSWYFIDVFNRHVFTNAFIKDISLDGFKVPINTNLRAVTPGSNLGTIQDCTRLKNYALLTVKK